MKNYVIDFTVTSSYHIVVRAPSEEAARAWFDANGEDAVDWGCERDSTEPTFAKIDIIGRCSPDVTVDEHGTAQEEP